MKSKEYKDGRLFIFSSPLDSLPKTLFFAYFCLFFAILLTTLKEFVVGNVEGVGFTIFSIIAIVVSSIVCYRFGNKAFSGEKVFLNKAELQLIQLGLFGSTVETYDVSKIHDFRQLEKPKLTKHPLAGETFDYLGFQTEQQVINELHGDKRLAFVYEGKNVLFGENVASWEFDQLELEFYDITGNDFRYTDDYEQEVFPKS